MKKTKLFLIACAMALVALPALAGPPKDQYAPCPNGSFHIKYEKPADYVNGGWALYAPNGYAFVQTQVKAGQEHQKPVGYKPPVSYVEVFSTTKHDISHVHACKVKEPPPNEEPVCKWDFFLDDVYFDYGFAEAGGSIGSGCGNHEPFIGDPGETFHLEVCLDAKVVNGEFIPPFQVPYIVRTTHQVQQESAELTGTRTLTYGDPAIEGCKATADFSWILYVLSTHDTDYCEPGEECWCKKFPDAKECKPPEEPCRAFADLKLGAVVGDSVEACLATLGDADISLALPEVFETDLVTFCWRSIAQGDEVSLVANADGQTHHPDPEGNITVSLPDGCGGWFSLVARNETCRAHDMITFSVDTEAPEACIPWLP